MLLDRVEKPGRYTGGELNSVYKQDAEINFALCFPDVYEVGMSHLGINILYEVLNALDFVYVQRAFCPWVDMMEELRKSGDKLATLETRRPLDTFDLVGFNLSYEMCYSNVLAMLDLGGIPLLADERDDRCPMVVGGGACTVNPEPMAAFFDLFVIGEGEEVAGELCALLREHKRRGFVRADFLREAAGIEGVYAPSLYEVAYNGDGTVRRVTAANGVPQKVKRRFVADFDAVRTIARPVVPYIGTVHDRCTLEIMRGCSNGCRFCQAGYVTRPVRHRQKDTVLHSANYVINATGYDEISLCSLSSGDHPQIRELIEGLIGQFKEKRVSVSLPSMRVSGFDFAEQLNQVRRTGLTFAPEAGTQRLRDVINKNITGEEIQGAAAKAFEAGANRIKLYFMTGLPTETYEDLDGIADLVRRIQDQYFKIPKQDRNGALTITASASCFAPKPGTPFQWDAQDAVERMKEKQYYLKDRLKIRGVRFHYHDARLSFLEAAFARGDRRVAPVILRAYRGGAVMDAWQEHFSYERYGKAFEEQGVDPRFYALREREYTEVLPWAHIDNLVSRDYLMREREKAYSGEVTPDCRKICAGCGLQARCTLHGGAPA
jgi:radical SAM family uncharacterized protein